MAINLENFENISQGEIIITFNPAALSIEPLDPDTEAYLREILGELYDEIFVPLGVQPGRITVNCNSISDLGASIMFTVLSPAADLNLDCSFSGLKDTAGQDVTDAVLDADFGPNKSFVYGDAALPFIKFAAAQENYWMDDSLILSTEEITVGEFLAKLTNPSDTVIIDSTGAELADNAKIPNGSSVLSYYSDQPLDTRGFVLLGDVNCDGSVTAGDARAALRIVTLLDTCSFEQYLAANIEWTGEGENAFNAKDARELLRYSTKLSNSENWIEAVRPLYEVA
ncbi:MAG: hypothetical protein GX851_07100 [Clostridiales bacterium]|nr:hypothetical protein [Clostridiales bacterium]